MSKRTVRIIDCTFDPVTGLVEIDFKLKPEAESHRSLYQAVARSLDSGNPLIEVDVDLGEYPKDDPEGPTVLTGDIEIFLKIPLGSLEAEEKKEREEKEKEIEKEKKEKEVKEANRSEPKEIKLDDLKSKEIKLKPK